MFQDWGTAEFCWAGARNARLAVMRKKVSTTKKNVHFKMRMEPLKKNKSL